MIKVTKSRVVFIACAVVVFFLLALTSIITIYSKGSHSSGDVDKPGEVVDASAKKTIVYSYGGNDFSIKHLVRSFQEAYPDIEVKLQQLQSSTDYQRNVYKTAFSSGDSSVDVFSADIIWVAELAFNGWVLPLDEYFDEDMRRDFFPNAIEACSFGGKIYAVPNRTDAPFLYYRKDIIASPPATYSELIEQARKHMDYPGIKYGYVFQGYAYEGLVCNALEFIWNNGGSVFENGRASINSPEAIEGLQIMIDIVNSGISSPDVLSFQEDDSIIAFSDGSSIFMRNWPYAYTHVNSGDSKVKGKVGIAPLPIGPKGKSSSGTLGGWNFMINKNSKNPELAWKFIEWMSSYETQVMDNRLGGYAPTRKPVYDDAELQKLTPWISQFKSIFENAKPRPVSPYYPAVSESMQKNFFDALSGRITAKTAIENIERDLNNLMARQLNK